MELKSQAALKLFLDYPALAGTAAMKTSQRSRFSCVLQPSLAALNVKAVIYELVFLGLCLSDAASTEQN